MSPRNLPRPSPHRPVALPAHMPGTGPRRLEFAYGGAVRWLARYRADGSGWLARSLRDPREGIPHVAMLRCRPAAECWEEFWQSMEPLRLEGWRRAYRRFPWSRLRPGAAVWRLVLARGRLAVSSGGVDLYPQMWTPATATPAPETLLHLKSALEAVIAHSVVPCAEDTKDQPNIRSHGPPLDSNRMF